MFQSLQPSSTLIMKRQLSNDIREYENDSHISRKKKALARNEPVKNRREIEKEFIDPEDLDTDEDISYYSRYIK